MKGIRTGARERKDEREKKGNEVYEERRDKGAEAYCSWQRSRRQQLLSPMKLTFTVKCLSSIGEPSTWAE